MSGIDWEAYARIYDRFLVFEYASSAHEFYYWIVDQLDERDLEPRTILEIGCGTGFFVVPMLDWYPDSSFLLVDANAPMLAVARERMSEDSVEFFAMMGNDYLQSLQPDSIDVAIFSRSWYALDDPETASRDLVRCLRSGGLVFICDFHSPIDIKLYETVYAEREPDAWPSLKSALEDFNAGVAEGRYHLFGLDELAELWRRAGARIVAEVDHNTDSYAVCIAAS